MLNLHFTCPKCQENFIIRGWLKWILITPFHWFGRRYTKCPHCKTRQLLTWHSITHN